MKGKRCCNCKNILPEKHFSKSKSKKDGLQSMCKICHNKYLERYCQRFDIKERLKKYRQNYYQRPDIRQRVSDWNKAYWKSEKGRELRDRAYKKYMKTNKGKEAGRRGVMKYQQTTKGKLSMARQWNRRERDMKTIPLLLNPFPEDIQVEYHHVNNWFVVPIPNITHQYVSGNVRNNGHWEYNEEWIKKIYNLDIMELLNEKHRN